MTVSSPNERVYAHGPDRLRSPERRERLDVEKVVQLCLHGGNVKSLLDIGTGSALFAEAFHDAGVEVAGVDINAEMIEAAKKHVPGETFLLAPAESLPFADGLYDATFFGVVFHEVADYAKALHEAYRVARCCTFILEWPKKQEDVGPPLEHRVTEEFVRNLSVSAGYRKFTATPLGTLVLYTLVK